MGDPEQPPALEDAEKTKALAREFLRRLRILLAGDPAWADRWIRVVRQTLTSPQPADLQDKRASDDEDQPAEPRQPRYALTRTEPGHQVFGRESFGRRKFWTP
jgi:hypothetical protein